ncbi:MAG: RNA polymerase sigma factor [Clostridia bacterium]|nr:RNA polymerase sigma factor [Clostridia bacterium]
MSNNVLRNNELLEAVLNRNSATVYRTAYLRTGNVHDAEDIMQEVFLRFVKSKPTFENDEHEKAWFIRTTVNRTNSFFTSAWKRRVVPLDNDVITYDENDNESLMEAVMSLPKDIATAIHLYYYEDMPIKEIAATMNKSESAIKSLLFRGRKMLRISLKDSERNENDV